MKTAIPALLHACSDEMQQNTSDMSHNIQNEQPLEMPRSLSLLDNSGKYHNKNLPGEKFNNNH